MAVRGFFRRNKQYLLVFMPPILLLPLVVVESQESKCAYGLLLMACYWATQALPFAVTAMLALILFPMMGISKVDVLASKYTNSIIFVMIGGLAVAISVERWNLHKRFALKMLLCTGTSPKWLILGFMLTTSFTSAWISNMATTCMMIPIGQSVLIQLVKMEKQQKARQEINNKLCRACKFDNVEVEVGEQDEKQVDDQNFIVEKRQSSMRQKEIPSGDDVDFESLDPELKTTCKAMMLCICYSATIGGIATMTGTAPNLVLKAHADALSNGASGVTYASWFIFSFPIAFIVVIFAWVDIQITFFGIRSLFRKSDITRQKNIRKTLLNEYDRLGPMSFAEKVVLVCFIILVALWFTIKPEFIPGWSILFKDGYVGDAVPAIIFGSLLFVFPSRRARNQDNVPVPPILDWQTFSRRFPWDVCILLGGGFALAQACKDSGLSVWLAEQLNVFSTLPAWLSVLVICIIMSASTEIASNTAIANIFLPILADLAKSIKVHPVYFMLPGAISTSFAFMLPISTPPNVIAFSYGYLRVVDMVKVGWWLNIVCTLVLWLAINTWGKTIFGLDVFPEWANSQTSNMSIESNVNDLTSKNISMLI